jgi:hypothetical protein
MAAKPTIEPVATRPRSTTPPRPNALSEASGVRSPAARLVSWLRGDRYMVGAYPPDDAPPREREH